MLLTCTADRDEGERDGHRTVKRRKKREKEKRKEKKGKKQKTKRRENERSGKGTKSSIAGGNPADAYAVASDAAVSHRPSKDTTERQEEGDQQQTTSTIGSFSKPAAVAATALNSPVAPQAIAPSPTAEGGVVGAAGPDGDITGTNVQRAEGEELKAARAKAMVPMRPEEYAAQQRTVREVRLWTRPGEARGREL